MSPRQGLRPHSPNTSSVNRRVSRYFDILQAGSAAFVSLITTTKIQSLAQQVQCVNQHSRQQAGKQQSFKVESHPLPLPERKPKPIHDTEKQKNSSCKTSNTPAPIAPRKRENPQNSQYSKPTLKTETRKKIEKRVNMKQELKTRRQHMKYYFCAVIGVL